MNIPATYTIPEVAQILLCDEETAASRVIQGDLPGIKFGRSWVIPVQAFFQRLNELALEEAETRRQELQGERDKAKAKAAKAQGSTDLLSVSVPTPAQRGRQRRTPPPLPGL